MPGCTRWFSEEQIFRIDPLPGQGTAQNILAFRCQRLFEPIWTATSSITCSRCAETLSLGTRAGFYEARARFRGHGCDAFCFRSSPSWPWSAHGAGAGAHQRGEEQKSFAACCRSNRPTSCAVSTPAIVRSPASPGIGDGNLHCVEMSIDNWRWGGCSFPASARQNAWPKGRESFRSRPRAAQEHVSRQLGVGAKGRTT